MIIKGEGWRRTTSKMKWPLAEGASGGPRGREIPDSLLLDMRVMVPYPASAPFHIGLVSGSGGNLVLAIRDAVGVVVASVALSPSGEVGMARLPGGAPAGVALCDPAVVSAMAGGMEGREWSYQESDLPLAPSACAAYQPRELTTLSDGVSGTTGDVDMTGGGGVRFVVDGDAVRIDLHGEAEPEGSTIKTINGAAIRHLWLVSKPESEARVSGLRVTTRGRPDA